MNVLRNIIIGDIRAFIINDDEVIFRKILINEAGIILQPLNDNDYEPIFYSKKEIYKIGFKAIGKPVELRRKLKS